MEVFIKAMKVSVASLEESSALSWVYQWNLTTTIGNVLAQGDNMYLNAFNNDLIPREDFCRWTTYQPLFVAVR